MEWREQRQPEDPAGGVVMNVVSYVGEQHISFAAWLFRVARNLLIDRRRCWGRRSREKAPPDREAASELAGRVDPVQARARQANLELAVARLTEAQQELLALKFILGFSNGDIGQITGRNLRTVIGLQFRALGALKGILE